MIRLILALLLCLPIAARADSYTVIWEPVTQGIDGNPVVGLLGYRIYVSTMPGVYGATPKATVLTNSTVISETMIGTYYLIVRAYNSTGESANSNEVTFQVKPKVPAAPTGFRRVP